MNVFSRIFCHATLAFILGMPALAETNAAPPIPAPEDVFGVAHVDGKYFLTREDFLDEGADQVLATGSKVIKLYLTPRRYPWNSAWPEDISKLVEVAQTPGFRSVFTKSFRTYVLTAYSIGREDHYWTRGVNPEQAADETQQFYDLTKYLINTYKGSGKTFVLQNWEGDWALRTGSPKPYDPNYQPTPTATAGMIQWMNARQAGIVKARGEAGPSDVHVYGAIEANRLEDSMADKPGVANSVLPFTTVDLASYSSYGFLDTPERLTKAVKYMAAHLPGTAAFGQTPHSIYLGEFGYPENGREGSAGVSMRINNAISVTRNLGLRWAIFWEIYCNENVNNTVEAPLNGKSHDQDVRGFWMVKPDGTPSIAWQRYRRLFAQSDVTRANSRAVLSGLKPVFHDDFNRVDRTDLGEGWTHTSHYGVVNASVENGAMQFEIPDGRDIPWGSATLNLNDPAILGHGLEPGDYFEITARRVSDQGGLGLELFDSDQLRVGADLQKGSGELKAWNHTTWVPCAFDDHGAPLKFDWNSPHDFGVRFDTADGHFTTFSYYIDSSYAGSWLIETTARKLVKIGVYVQSRTPRATFVFSNLKVFAGR